MRIQKIQQKPSRYFSPFENYITYFELLKTLQTLLALLIIDHVTNELVTYVTQTIVLYEITIAK